MARSGSIDGDVATSVTCAEDGGEVSGELGLAAARGKAAAPARR
jgi:hypothetical protein